MPEKQLQALVERTAALHGWLRYHTFDSRRSVPGFPDLVLVSPPRLLFAELKTERGRLSAYQVAWLDELRLVPGVEVYEWRPSDWLDGTIVAVLRGEEVGE